MTEDGFDDPPPILTYSENTLILLYNKLFFN